MKIAIYDITSTVFHGGVQTFVWGIARALKAEGHVVHVFGGVGTISSGDIDVYKFKFIDRSRFINFGSRFRKFAERLSFAFYSFPALVKGKYDIIYIQKPYDLPVALLLRKLTKTKVYFSSHGSEFYPGYRALARRADKFFSCSRFNAEMIEKYCNIKPFVLYNGIDTDLFSPKTANLELKKRLGINSQYVLISACRLVGWKGLQYGIAALSELVKKYDITYLIIGGGDYKDELEAAAVKHKVENNIIFLGEIPNNELANYYAISDIALYPSVADETFGISIAEAMSCAKPVVTTTAGAIPEVADKDCAVLIAPKDAASIVNAVDMLINDSDLRRSLGVKGRKKIMDRFTWNIIVKRFREC
ncbi:glycosyl transferase, group 1 [Candidatus Magnetoovum chiemensis]|nr:glycosyl transferase, group 1 [Candidatus Magnetoovum chiemensis]